MAVVYKITSPSGKIYIGSTINVNQRFNRYKNLLCKPQRRLYNSLLKYGSEYHTFEIIEQCDEKEMFKLELKHGIFYKVLGENGLNCVLPKHDSLVYSETRAKEASCSPERREKARLASTGRKHSDEAKRKVSEANKGVKKPEGFSEKLKQIALNRPPVSEETREKLSLAGLGRKHSDSTLDKMKKPKSEEWKAKNRKPKSSNVNYMGEKNNSSRQIIDIKNGITYVSIKDAAEKLNVSIYFIKKLINEKEPYLKFLTN
jgi:group I intron endonuclease